MAQNTKNIKLNQMVQQLIWAIVGAILIVVGSRLTIPFGEIPLTLQSFFVMMIGLILGPRYSALAVIFYLVAGLVGLPVFAGGKNGFAPFIGATGGFLIGLIPCVVICGLACGVPVKPIRSVFIFCLLGHVVLLLLGSIMLYTNIASFSLSRAMSVGFISFIPGMLTKCIAATLCYKLLAASKLFQAWRLRLSSQN